MSATAGPRRLWAWTYWTLLAALLATGLYMRVANLNEVQHFEGDQGADYSEVMSWLKDRGPWPLLGQIRSVGDRGLGPGWFYTVAPAMALTNYHPAAGAATIAVMSVLTILLCADWVRRATSCRAAAIVAAGIFALSARWTEAGRTMWDPNTLPFAVAALAWLLALLPRRPVPCMAVALAIMAILPQWHTAGLLVDVAVLGPLMLAWRAARPAVAATPRRTWLLCGSALLIAIAFLYLPPLIHELRPGQGNFVGYFLKSDIPAQPYAGGFPRRALRALDGLVRWSAHENFSTTAQFVSSSAMILRLSVAGGCGAVFALLYWAVLRRRDSDPAAGFLALVVVVCWSILALKGHAIRDHYLIPAYAAMPLLIGWTAGRLIGQERMAVDSTPGTGGHGSIALRVLGLMVLLSAAGLSLAQFPHAWAIHEGAARYGHRLKAAQEVAAFIAGDSNGGPFSVDLAEADNFSAHFHYLLRRMGRPPCNEDDYSHRILRRDMGERIYVIVANTMTRVPHLEGLPGAPPTPVLELDDYSVHRLEVASLPPQTRAIELVIDAPAWTIRAER